MRRTKKEAEETKQSILEAARALFVQKGFGLTTLDDIASLAGFTRGAVHWHFQNKLGVLAALQELEGSPMQNLIDKLAIDEGLDPISALNTTVETFFKELVASPDKKRLFQLIFRELHNRMFDMDFDRSRRFEIELRQMTANILSIADQRGQLCKCWTPETAAIAFQTMIKGMIMSWLYETAFLDLKTEGIVTVTSFLNSLRCEGAVS